MKLEERWNMALVTDMALNLQHSLNKKEFPSVKIGYPRIYASEIHLIIFFVPEHS